MLFLGIRPVVNFINWSDIVSSCSEWIFSHTHSKHEQILVCCMCIVSKFLNLCVPYLHDICSEVTFRVWSLVWMFTLFSVPHQEQLEGPTISWGMSMVDSPYHLTQLKFRIFGPHVHAPSVHDIQNEWYFFLSTGDEDYWKHQTRPTNCNVQCHISSANGSTCTAYSHQTNRNTGIYSFTGNVVCLWTFT